MIKNVTQTKRTTQRPPVVVVMGHIDHGKTTFLDYVRKSNVVQGEAGGITQHIGAHQIEHAGRSITFLDTPGHAAFSRMRSRGAQVADIAILMVAADDGVKPQTEEALKAAQEVGVSIIVAINKIDKPEASLDKVKGELAEKGVLVEGWGGSVPVAAISARTGEGVPDLLDLVLLAADVEDFVGDTSLPGSGVVIESHLDPRRGPLATLLVKDGTLHKGDWAVSGSLAASIKNMDNSLGEQVVEAMPSSPVQVLGFGSPPEVGETFLVYPGKKEAEEAVKNYKLGQKESISASQAKISQERTKETIEVPLVVKADVAGSLEAIEGELCKLHAENLHIRIVRKGIGDISDDDIKSVSSENKAIILGFKVKVSSSASALADRFEMQIKTFDVIYELLDWFVEAAESRIPPKIERVEGGRLKILKIFKRDGAKQVFGGRVTMGSIKNESSFDVTRGESVVGSGVITSLQHNKMDVPEVTINMECGLAGEVIVELTEGDVLRTYTEHSTKQRIL